MAPVVEQRYGLGGAASRRALLGWSNGAEWSLDYGVHHPGFADTVVALSPTAPRQPLAFSDLPGRRFELRAGRFEPAILDGVAAGDTVTLQ